ncbi:probable purine permease 10 [Neltuma alba]|nr:probable purine permease 10 [Prosopis alba]
MEAAKSPSLKEALFYYHTTCLYSYNRLIVSIVLEADEAKEKKPSSDAESDSDKKTNPNGDTSDFPDEASTTIINKKRHQRWLRIALYAVPVLLGQSAATLLGRLYYQEGGHSKWLGTLVTFVGFPLLLPFYSILAFKRPSATNTSHSHEQPPVSKLAFVYVSLGLLVALDSYLFSFGLSYLPVSTYSLVCSSQLAFNAFFSFFLNSLKLTPYTINSLVLLTISSVLLVFHTDSPSASTQVSKRKYAIGFIFTVAGSAGYGLVLSLTQFAFRKVLKKQSVKVILDVLVYESLVATLAILVGLFASGEFRGLRAEMKDYGMGKASYVLNLSFTAISWQLVNVGCVGLILEVSSVFSNVINVMGLPIVPVLALAFFHDKMNALKAISLVLALWGFLSYTYQQYLDGINSYTDGHKNNDEFLSDSVSEGLNGISGQAGVVQ